MHIGADVTLLREQRRAGVKTHPHRQIERVLGLARGFERTGRGRKRDEECVSLRVDLDAAVTPERLAQNTPLLGQPAPVLLRAELVEKARRPLDVREEERDGAARQLAHAASLRRRSTRAGGGAASQPSAQLRRVRSRRRRRRRSRA